MEMVDYEFCRDGDSNLFLRIEAEPKQVESWWNEWIQGDWNYNGFYEFVLFEKNVHVESIDFYSIGFDYFDQGGS